MKAFFRRCLAVIIVALICFICAAFADTPKENIISPDLAEDVSQFARDCLSKRFEVESDTLAQMDSSIKSFKLENAVDLWVIEFYPDSEEKYVVEVELPTYKLQLCALYVNDVLQYTEDTVIRSADESSDSVNTVEETDQLIVAAWNALKDTYQFEDATLGYLNAHKKVESDKTIVSFDSKVLFSGIIGTYTVVIDMNDHAVASVSWDLQSNYDKLPQSEYWSQSPIFSAVELNSYVALRAAIEKLVSDADAEDEWHLSFEQLAARDELYRNAGYAALEYYHGLPAATDLQLDDATLVAQQAIVSSYGIDAKQLESYCILYEFDVSDIAHPTWHISILNTAADIAYIVEIDASDNEILQIYTKAGSNG